MAGNERLSIIGHIPGCMPGKCTVIEGESITVEVTVISELADTVKVAIGFDDEYFKLTNGAQEYELPAKTEKQTIQLSWTLLAQKMALDKIWVYAIAKSGNQMQKAGFPIMIKHQ